MGTKTQRGSTDNGKRLAALLGGGNGTGKQGADWGSADPRWIVAVITAVCRLGGAASFGLSRDGGAYSLTILLDGDRQTLWYNGSADLDAELEKVYETFNTAAF